MDAIVKFLEKHQALFDKISKNIYLVGGARRRGVRAS